MAQCVSINIVEKKYFIDWARDAMVSYQASQAVSQQMSQIDLIALVGPTGVGKTTIIEKLEIPYVLSDVTRQPREGEKDGHEYFFRSDYFDMLEEVRRGEYVQFLVARNGEFYGTRAINYPKSGSVTMAVLANALPAFRKLGFRKVIPIYILPPSYIEWMHRIGSSRSGDIGARMIEARESLPMALSDPTYNFVLNDDLELALGEVKLIIGGGKISQHRDALARESADLLFGRLGIDDELLN